METDTQTAAQSINQRLAGQALGTAKKFVVVFGTLAATVLAADVALSLIGEEPTSFMCGRTGGVLASAVVLYWLWK
ncbi:hypothetical protein [Spirillospora sp. CA-294931]|uniref:hypothetical protein n=1 Tax=Spirillospora sp. CA-294931 TaxID=3240042 RepID=UPI003D8BE7D7